MDSVKHISKLSNEIRNIKLKTNFIYHFSILRQMVNSATVKEIYISMLNDNFYGEHYTKCELLQASYCDINCKHIINIQDN